MLGPRDIHIDESGDPLVHHKGASTLFVLAAAITDSDKTAKIEAKAREIQEQYFPKGEIKSSKIGSNTNRRVEILREVAELDIKFYCQVIDKTAIFQDSGLTFKKSFLKFIHRSFYQRVFRAYSNLNIFADEHGSSEFMQGFQSYLQKWMPPKLFESAFFKFVPSDEAPLVQIADLVAGTVSRVYDQKEHRSVLDPIESQIIIIDEWPPRVPTFDIPTSGVSVDQQHDLLIRQEAVEQALRFVDENTISVDDSIGAQVAAVRYLLYHFRSIDPEEYVPTARLRHHLAGLGYPMSERQLRTKVIGRLRDKSVFIVSSTKGIKLPYGITDVYAFLQRVNTQVLPYLNRVKVLRNHFRIATEGDLDILDKDNFPELHKLLKGGV